MHDLLTEERKRFQVDRLILFSDAVFAIAITLLIIEIHPPSLEGLPATDSAFGEKMAEMIPEFIGFFMSFALIGLYWSKHHAVFGYITDYSPKLIFLNLVLLAAIVLMPFSTQVYSAYVSEKYVHLLGPFLIYSLNIILCGLANFWIWVYITKPGNPVCKQVFPKRFVRNAKLRALVLPFTFFISFMACWIFDAVWGRYLLMLIPFYFRLIKDDPKEKKEVRAGKAGK
ncbi:Protein of unknown function [Arachidicoccus rhizosphaerae]|uniref:DUF1211 domain-containing protein n=1 Tax=Arachidicoccus rhizosphaerae TaxID=551991 RepID=A0A1H4CBK5_9BACT|nr:TMEM175 family protein [Arachidicoccus rhizosphaerae]SEA57767.1 Protein of unknown function [Arachidicoccus rhizosphaerae]